MPSFPIFPRTLTPALQSLARIVYQKPKLVPARVLTVNGNGTYTVQLQGGSQPIDDTTRPLDQIVTLPATGETPGIQVDDLVQVAVRYQTPKAIVSHTARRAQFHPAAPVAINPLVEELFVGRDTATNTLDIYFRNYSVVTPLGVNADIRLEDFNPFITLRWGESADSFIVGVIGSTGQRNLFYVYTLNRKPDTPLAPHVKPKKKLLRIDRVDQSNLLLCRMTITGQGSGVSRVRAYTGSNSNGCLWLPGSADHSDLLVTDWADGGAEFSNGISGARVLESRLKNAPVLDVRLSKNRELILLVDSTSGLLQVSNAVFRTLVPGGECQGTSVTPAASTQTQMTAEFSQESHVALVNYTTNAILFSTNARDAIGTNTYKVDWDQVQEFTLGPPKLYLFGGSAQRGPGDCDEYVATAGGFVAVACGQNNGVLNSGTLGEPVSFEHSYTLDVASTVRPFSVSATLWDPSSPYVSLSGMFADGGHTDSLVDRREWLGKNGQQQTGPTEFSITGSSTGVLLHITTRTWGVWSRAFFYNVGNARILRWSDDMAQCRVFLPVSKITVPPTTATSTIFVVDATGRIITKLRENLVSNDFITPRAATDFHVSWSEGAAMLTGDLGTLRVTPMTVLASAFLSLPYAYARPDFVYDTTEAAATKRHFIAAWNYGTGALTPAFIAGTATADAALAALAPLLEVPKSVVASTSVRAYQVVPNDLALRRTRVRRV
jgi:hypothetical protein